MEEEEDDDDEEEEVEEDAFQSKAHPPLASCLSPFPFIALS